MYLIFDPQGCRWRSNPGLKLANAFGVLQTGPVCNTESFYADKILGVLHAGGERY